MDDDTIAAISTPMGEGAIAIVRLSGEDALDTADRLFLGKSGHALGEVRTHTMHYGTIIDPETQQTIEEVMVSIMRAPKTFTRENIVEINCHGGIVSVNRVLELTLQHGARLAEPGEFTKRAFLNGRIDLSQAEAVMDLIRAKTDRAMNLAMGQMEGRLSELIKRLRQTLLETVAHVEVNIDYPEFDAEETSRHWLLQQATSVRAEIGQLITTAKQGKILREGLSTVIVGRPNVGKSSLLNSLVQENKAIVTEVPGTTRDVVEEYVSIRGIPLRLLDTAGIRETEDIVERMGVDRSRQVMSEADMTLLLLNNNEPLDAEDEKLFAAIEGMEAIIVVNKNDLPNHLSLADIRDKAGNRPVVTTSLLEDEGIEQLEKAISSLFFSGDVEAADAAYVSNSRHVALLHQANTTINDAISAMEEGVPLDMAQIDLTRTWEILGDIVGDTVSEGLIDQLFSQFCLGK